VLHYNVMCCICLVTYNNITRVVKRSSYRLNSLILVAVFVGFIGTLLHVIKLDDDMSELLTATICNVSYIYFLKYC